MCEPAVLAPDGKMPATYRYIMGTGYVTVSAFRGFKKVPDIVTPNCCECSWLSDIFNTGDKDAGRTAVFTCHLCLIRYRFYDLFCHLFTMVAVSAEFCKNEPVAHRKYWMCTGSLICCTIHHEPDASASLVIKPNNPLPCATLRCLILFDIWSGKICHSQE
jgi:hypothetical protein